MIPFTPSRPDTVGVEIELQLLDPQTLDLQSGISRVLEVCRDLPWVKAEFLQSQVEVASKVCRSAQELEAHLRTVVSELHSRCVAHGIILCGGGSHPFCDRLGKVTPLPRYRSMSQTEGYLAHSQLVFATHVHLGMRSAQETIDVMRAVLPYLPLLIAISASSPFWRGERTGFASYRHRTLAATRSYGIPPTFHEWEEFSRFFEASQRAGFFSTFNDIHWDVRPRPHFGTLEVRVMDAQPSVAEAVNLAVMLRALVRHLRTGASQHAEGLPTRLPWWIAKENHYQAARLGLDARYVTDVLGNSCRLAAVWREVYALLQPEADALGEGNYFRRLAANIERGISCVRQVRVFEETGSLEEVTRSLIQEFEAEVTAH